MSHDKEKHQNRWTEGFKRVFTALWKVANNDVIEFCSYVP